MPPNHQKLILLVEDEADSRFAIELFLSSFGYIVDSFGNSEDALRVFDPNLHDAVLTDNSMPGMTGVEMARIIKFKSPSTPVVMHTGSPPEDRSCLDLVLQKPVPLMHLKQVLDELLAKPPLAE